jgi:hypothetical protein
MGGFLRQDKYPMGYSICPMGFFWVDVNIPWDIFDVPWAVSVIGKVSHGLFLRPPNDPQG